MAYQIFERLDDGTMKPLFDRERQTAAECFVVMETLVGFGRKAHWRKSQLPKSDYGVYRRLKGGWEEIIR